MALSLDKACSFDQVKVGANKILPDLSEIDGLNKSELFAEYILTQNERK